MNHRGDAEAAEAISINIYREDAKRKKEELNDPQIAQISQTNG